MTFRKFGDDFDTPLRQDLPGPPLPAVITNPTEARIVALNSVTSHCGFCGRRFVGHEVPADHRCQDPAGRDLTEVKRAHAEGARRAFRALTNWTPPPCEICGRSYPAGASHDCGFPTSALPHDAAAAAFQRAGTARAVAELENERAMTTPDPVAGDAQ